ncbi:MAG: helix-turn-helix transcriptional regulator [Spirochaetales bacterium]|nr:helix-turn-helix transcriptional regulator [Spirochaetales bacterium]
MILWFIAYTAGVVRLSVAVLLFIRNREQTDIKKIIFLLSFGGVILSLSNMELLYIFGSENANYAGHIGLYFSAALAGALPIYVHTTVVEGPTIYRDIPFAIIGLVLLILQIIYRESTMLLVLIVMSCCIIYSMICLLTKNKTPDLFEKKVNNILSFIVIILVILMIFFDILFPISKGYIFIPIVYFWVNVMMLLPEIPQFAKPENRFGEKDLVTSMENFGLTKRECEVALLLVKGKSYQDIGDTLFISLQTVKTHAARIYKKTGTGSKLELLDKTKKL